MNEFVEIAYTSDVDISSYYVAFYNGNDGSVYSATPALSPGTLVGSGVSLTTVTVTGLQNGPDGIALVDVLENTVVEFISYEGSFVATDGVAVGMVSVDIGVREGASTGSTDSIQRTGGGCSASDFAWSSPRSSTIGGINTGQLFTCAVSVPERVWINEFHYDNSGSDSAEFVEIAYTTPVDITSYTLLLYNGNGGGVYSTKSIGTGTSSSSGVLLTVVAVSGMQNGPDGLALVDPSNKVVQFISYEGTFTATDGAAFGMTSTDVGVSESDSTAVGESIQATGTGCKAADFTWMSPQSSTAGSVNFEQTFQCGASTNGVVDNNMLSNASGSGSITTSATVGSSTTIGDLPLGIADVYIELDSIVDVDIELFSGSTCLISRSMSSPKREHSNWNGLRLEYSGFRGEDTNSTLGEEFLFVSGVIPSALTFKVYGAQSGSVTIKYWWGYYDTSYGKTGTMLKSSLHDIIDEHTEISYSAAWGAIKVC